MTKFKRGDKVLYGDEERSIVVCRKNFSNQSIIYKLDTGEQVEEKDLKALGKSKLTRKKKPVQPTKEELKLKARLEELVDYQEYIDYGNDTEEEFNTLITKMTDKQFNKFKEQLIEKAIEKEDNTED